MHFHLLQSAPNNCKAIRSHIKEDKSHFNIWTLMQSCEYSLQETPWYQKNRPKQDRMASGYQQTATQWFAYAVHSSFSYHILICRCCQWMYRFSKELRDCSATPAYVSSPSWLPGCDCFSAADGTDGAYEQSVYLDCMQTNGYLWILFFFLRSSTSQLLTFQI